MNLKTTFRWLLSFIITLLCYQSLHAQPNPFGDSRFASNKGKYETRFLSYKFSQYSALKTLFASPGGSPQIDSIVAPDTLMLPQSGSYNFDIRAIVTDADSLTDVDSVWFFSRNSSNPNLPFYLSNNGNGEWSVLLSVSSSNRVDTYPFVFYAKDIEGNLSDSVVHNITLVAYTTSVESQIVSKPNTFALSQNYPNPFNPLTNISFNLQSKSFISLKVFDLTGKEVTTIVSGELSAGNYTRQWNAENVPSGVYFYRLQVGSFAATKKLVLLK